MNFESPPDLRHINEQPLSNPVLSENNVVQESTTKTTLAKEILALRENQELLKAEIAEQHEYLEYIATHIKKIKRYIMWSYIGEAVKLLLIIVPMILAYFALKPYLSQAIGGWANIQAAFQELGGASGAASSGSGLDILNLLK